MLDQIKQQLNSVRVIQFVSSLKSLCIHSPCLIPTFCQLTAIVKESYCSLHKDFTMRRSIWLQYKICPFPSTSWILKWCCHHLRGAGKQVAPAFLLPYFTAPLEQDDVSHQLTSRFPILHSREKSMHFSYAYLYHHLPIEAGQTEFSSAIQLSTLRQIVKRGAGVKQGSIICDFKGWG